MTDWQGLYEQAKATIADLHKQLEATEGRLKAARQERQYTARQLEAAQEGREGWRQQCEATIRQRDEYKAQLEALKRSATQIEDLKTKLETARQQEVAASSHLIGRIHELEEQLEAARKEIIAGDALANVQHEGDLEEYKQLAALLEAAQRELAEKGDAINTNALTATKWAQEAQAERTKREEAEQACPVLRGEPSEHVSVGTVEHLEYVAEEAERRLGEALAALEEVTAIELYSPTWNVQWMKARDKARAVLASQTEENKE